MKCLVSDDNRPIVRKAAYAGFAWMFGLFLGGSENLGIAAAAAVLLSAAVCAVFLIGKKTTLLCAVFAASGIIYSYGYTVNTYLPTAALAGRDIVFEGRITDITDYGAGFSGYEADGKVNGGIRAKIIIRSETGSARISDKIRATGKVSLISDTFTFPAHSYYRSKGIFLRMNRTDNAEVSKYDGFSLYRSADEFARYIGDSVRSVLPGEEGAMICAMLTGDKSGLESSTKTKLFRAGCGHITAVSGIHLTVIYTVISAVLGSLPISRKTVFLLSLPFMMFFCFAAGLTPSVIRAAVMLIFLNIGYFAGRRSDIMNTLGICGMLLTVKMPYAVYDTRLILSFAGVIGTGIVSSKISGRACEYIASTRLCRLPRSVINAAVGSFSVSAAVFPFSILIFDEAPLISPITNILMIPLCTAAMTAGAFGAVFGGIGFISYPMLIIAGLFCKPVLAWADLVYNADMLFIPSGFPAVKIVSAVLCFGSIAAVMYCRDFVKASAAVFSVMLAAVSSVMLYRALIPDDIVKFAFLCSGNSAAAVIHNGHTASAADICGNGKAAAMCEKYLRREGIDKLDVMILRDQALSSAAEYKEILRLFDTASFAVPAGNSRSDFAMYDEDIIFCSEDTLLGTGYFILSDISDDGMIFRINDRELGIYTSDMGKIGENMLFTAVCGRGNKADSSSAKYVVCSCGGEYAEGDHAENICIEITIHGNREETRVIFDGGSD